MKRLLILITALSTLALSGCKKFLTTQPDDFVSPENFYRTEQDLQNALVGVYDYLGSNNLYAYRIPFYLGLEGDDGYFALATQTGARVHDFGASDAEVRAFWSTCYAGIGRANMLLANIDRNPAVDVRVRDVVRGEALFLRAYYHFMLTRAFGDIPYYEKPVVSAEKVDFPATPSAAIYNKIIADMTTAEGLVQGIQQARFGGRVTKSAVRGILARVCLTMAGNPINDKTKYAEARKWAKMVMDDVQAGHRVHPSFSQIFINYAQDLYDTGESIWEVEFWGNGSGAFNESGYIGSVNGPASTNPLTGTAVGRLRITGRLYNLYDDADQRKWWSCPSFRYSATGPSGTKTFFAITSLASRYVVDCGKFRREYELVTPKGNNVGPQNYPILRYSDVVLMFAEAENEINGPSAAAVAAMNELRRARWSRSIRTVTITNGGSGYTSAPTVSFTGGGGSGAVATATVASGRVTGISFSNDAVSGFTRGNGYTSAPTVAFTGGGGAGAEATVTINRIEDADLPSASTASPEAFRQFIQDERSRELCFEGHRKYDLIRWGIFVETMHAMADRIAVEYPTLYALQYFRNVDEKHLLWPIPTEEMTLNGALTQNKGW